MVLLHEARHGRDAPRLARLMLWLGIGVSNTSGDSQPPSSRRRTATSTCALWATSTLSASARRTLSSMSAKAGALATS
ncbi:MAG: hypothetical protein ACRDPY_25980 [Streptosporangiaceae bacterium]